MGPPRVPKTSHRAPKGAKWDPKGVPRGPQERPRGLHGCPKGSQGLPKGAQRDPKGPQWTPKGSPKSVPKWVPVPNPEKGTPNDHFLVAPGVKTIKNTRVWHRCPLGPKGVKIAKTHKKTSIF